MTRGWIVAALLVAGTAHAAMSCHIRQAGGFQFAPYDVTSTQPNDASLQLVIGCDRNGGPASVTVEVAIGASAVSGSVSSRRMSRLGGGDQLAYNLYRDPSRSAVWGMTSGLDTGVQTITQVPNKGTGILTFTIFARIDRLQDVRVGSYADSVPVTINP